MIWWFYIFTSFVFSGLPLWLSVSLYLVCLCRSSSLQPSVHIIMSGRQISTMAIVGPSVYLHTRRDSLCYNKLISLPPRTSISSQLKIETIIAVGGVTLVALSRVHRSPPPPQTANWPWRVRSAMGCADFEGWQTDKLSYQITVSSLLRRVFLLWERWMLHISVHVSVCTCSVCTECTQEDVMLIKGRGRGKGSFRHNMENYKEREQKA